MQQIGKLSLNNQGGFVVKLQFQFIDSKGEKQHVDGTGGFPIGQTQSADPGDYGVPDGSPVTVYAFVVWGRDHVGEQLFYYSKGNTWAANFTISGTTLDNQLGFTGLSGG